MARVILKPSGILLLLGAFAVLACLALIPRFFTSSLTGGLTRVSFPLEDKSAVPWVFGAKNPDDGTMKFIALTEGPEGAQKAIQIMVAKEDTAPWNVQVYHDTPIPIKSGEQWELRFFGRSAKSPKITVNFELSREPYDKDLTASVQLAPQWKQFVLPFTTSRAYGARESKVSLQVGVTKGVYEFTGVELVKTGTASPAAKR